MTKTNMPKIAVSLPSAAPMKDDGGAGLAPAETTMSVGEPVGDPGGESFFDSAITLSSPGDVPAIYRILPVVDSDAHLTIYVTIPEGEPIEVDFDSNTHGEIVFGVTTEKVEDASRASEGVAGPLGGLGGKMNRGRFDLSAVSPEGVDVHYLVLPLVGQDGRLSILVRTPGDEPIEVPFDSNTHGEIAFRVTTRKIEDACSDAGLGGPMDDAEVNRKGTLQYKLTDIVYDTDGETVEGLPTELVVEVSPDFDMELDGADLISDETGWCVESFSHERIGATAILDAESRRIVDFAKAFLLANTEEAGDDKRAVRYLYDELVDGDPEVDEMLVDALLRDGYAARSVAEIREHLALILEGDRSKDGFVVGALGMDIFEHDVVNFLPESEAEANEILGALNALKLDEPEVIRRLVHFSVPSEYAKELPKVIDQIQQEGAELRFCEEHDL